MTLAAIGVRSQSFMPSPVPVWEQIERTFEVATDVCQVKAGYRLRSRWPRELVRLECEAKDLLELLRAAPAAVFGLPKCASVPVSAAENNPAPAPLASTEPPGGPTTPAPPQQRLSADPVKGIITLDRTEYQVKPAQAAFVRALVRANGSWRSANELKMGESELDGVRLDRLYKSLPEPIKALIASKRGAGYRLKVEELA
jgi:hypothetical protein